MTLVLTCNWMNKIFQHLMSLERKTIKCVLGVGNMRNLQSELFWLWILITVITATVTLMGDVLGPKLGGVNMALSEALPLQQAAPHSQLITALLGCLAEGCSHIWARNLPTSWHLSPSKKRKRLSLWPSAGKHYVTSLPLFFLAFNNHPQ